MDSNWFVFDNTPQDICLLTHFHCGTQIVINEDQRCNCFVKYLNEIYENSNDNDYRQVPCRFGSTFMSADENIDNYSKFKSLQYDSFSDLSEKKLKKRQIDCPNEVLNRCYQRNDNETTTTPTTTSIENESCLYRKFIAKSYVDGSSMRSTIETDQYVDRFLTNDKDNNTNNKSTPINTLILTVILAIVLIISFVSLVMSLFVIVINQRRKSRGYNGANELTFT
jgi:hypothetical protein